MNEQEKAFLREFFGHLIIEYREKSYSLELEEHFATVNGKPEKIEHSITEYQYEFVAADDSKVVLRSQDEDGNWQLEMLHFEDDDTFWIYVGSHPQFWYLNIREYFVRIE